MGKTTHPTPKLVPKPDAASDVQKRLAAERKDIVQRLLVAGNTYEKRASAASRQSDMLMGCAVGCREQAAAFERQWAEADRKAAETQQEQDNARTPDDISGSPD